MTALSTLSLKKIREFQLFKNYKPQYKQAYFSLQQKCVRNTTIPGYKPQGSRDHRDRICWPNPSLVERGGGGGGGGRRGRVGEGEEEEE